MLQVDGNVHTWVPALDGVRPLPAAALTGLRPSQQTSPPAIRTESSRARWRGTPRVEPAEQADWFSLELGLDVEGAKVNPLPPLLEVLEESGGGASTLDALMRIPARFRAVQVESHRYLMLPPERLRSLLEVLIELYRGEHTAEGGCVSRGSRRRVSPSWRTSSRARGGRFFEKDPRSCVGGASRSRAPPRCNRRCSPRALRAELRPYQREGVAWLQHLRASDAGASSPTTWVSARRCRRSRTSSLEKETGRLDRAGADRHADEPRRQLAARARAVRAGRCGRWSITAPDRHERSARSSRARRHASRPTRCSCATRRARRDRVPPARPRRGARDQEPAAARARARSRALDAAIGSA